MDRTSTAAEIKAEIVQRLGTELNTGEGSFAGDVAASVAEAIWEAVQEFEAVVNNAFNVDADSGEYIDLMAAIFGLSRKEGTKAEGDIAFQGATGTEIPAGAVFLTAGGAAYELIEAVTLDENGDGVGTLQCRTAGAAGNAAEREVNASLVTLAGVNAFASGEMTGGTDRESDGALYERYRKRIQAPPTGGSKSDYEEWALEVDGVGMAKCLDKWDGPGTVKVLLADGDGAPVPDSVAAAAKEHIEGLRPCCVELTTASAKGVTVDISAKVTLEAGAKRETAEEAFRQRMAEYIQEISFTGYTVVYNRAAALLMTTAGIADFTELTLNGGAGNVTLAADEVPVLGTVTLE